MAVDGIIRDLVTNTPAIVDQFSGHLVTMGEAHARIHEGVFYSLDEVALSLADAASIEVLIRTPALSVGVTHFRVVGRVGGDARLSFFEGPTSSADGAALTPINRNRLSANTANTLLFLGPTLSADGTALTDVLIPGGDSPHAPGGGGGIFGEFILAASTDYLARLTNISGSGQDANLQFDFYEPA